jgi:2-oxoglutarate dehydrogenase E2 component (dihydrolipoamide succinyltransferase)
MAVDVLMPQMGESIAEGTVSRWLKKVGDKVERDEPLLEISTDKVDAEIPSPAAGTLSEILANEGDTVAVNSVVARLAAEGQAAAPAPAESPAKEPPKEEKAAPAPQAPAPAPSPAPAPAVAPAPATAAVTSIDERRRTRSSPLVRKIAAENNIDISGIEGSGLSGRVTKNDILDYIESGSAAQAAAPSPAPSPSIPARTPAVVFRPGEQTRIEPMSVMRKKIAHHMIQSKQTSAHVSTVFEMDFTKIDKLRRQYKQSYAERGVKLTFMPFIVQAVIPALRAFPEINASLDGDNIIYKNEINIGIAVSLDWGLIVPVLQHADEKNILGLARAIGDIGERARTKKLSPTEVQGGTFTITNPGIYGGLFGLPIINQPQVAILGVGGVKKRPVVIESEAGDSIAIRSMCYLSLTFDHRLIDGAVADQFMAMLRETIEGGNYSL